MYGNGWGEVRVLESRLEARGKSGIYCAGMVQDELLMQPTKPLACFSGNAFRVGEWGFR